MHVTVSKRNDISNDLRKATLAAHQSLEGYRSFPNHSEFTFLQRRRTFQKLKTFETVANYPRSGHSQVCPYNAQRHGKIKVHHKLQSLVSRLQVKVHGRTKTTSKNRCCLEVLQHKFSSLKRTLQQDLKTCVLKFLTESSRCH